MSIGDARYVSLTTFRADGSPKALPVWVVDLANGRVAVVTAASTWKVKRVRADPRVELRPCNARGVPTEGGEMVAGTAVLDQGDDLAAAMRAARRKYGMQFRAMGAVHTVQSLFGRVFPLDTALVITPA